MDLNFANSSNSDHHETNTSYTRDGWSFKENKIYENAMTKFEDTSSMEFFEHVAFLMPWQTIDSIKNHEKVLMKDMKYIKSSTGQFEDLVEEDMEMEEETKKEVTEIQEETEKEIRKTKKRGIPWTPEEHKSFLRGLKECGKGEWKTISKEYVTSKTAAQIASHAQKFEKHKHSKTPPGRRRQTIHDIELSPEHSFPSDCKDFQSNQLNFTSNFNDQPNILIPTAPTNIPADALNFQPTEVDQLENYPTSWDN